MKRKYLFLLLFAAGCAPGTKVANPGPVHQGLSCPDGGIAESAFLKSGIHGDNTAILPNGRRITPAGTLIRLAAIFPMKVVVSPDGAAAYITHNGGGPKALEVVDLAQGGTVQAVNLGSAFRGMVLSKDGKTLYVAAASRGEVRAYNVKDDHTLDTNAPGTFRVFGYVSDLALSPDGAALYAVANTSSEIVKLDAETLKKDASFKAGTLPYAMEVTDHGELLVTSWGSDELFVLDADTGAVKGVVKTDKSPEGLAYDPNRRLAFVADADSDSITVVDLNDLKATGRIVLGQDALDLKGGNVTEVALSPGYRTLYATEAGFNKVDVVDISGTPDTFQRIGEIPTGWYPTGISATGDKLYILSAKGMGSRQALKDLPGLLSVVPVPGSATLAGYTTQVEANNTRTEKFYRNTCVPQRVPVLKGKDSPIKHVVLIVRENKTYDQVLGDCAQCGDGDKTLTEFGRKVTPNIHKLAKTFANLDNYYSNPEVSIQGHMWTTQAYCSDYVEKFWIEQLPVAGYQEPSLPENGTVFDLMFKEGVAFRNYGEFPSFGPYMFDKYADFIDYKYPFFNMSIPDMTKADEYLREVNLGIMPAFTYICLPNDHTFGSRAGAPSPVYMVAENDEATGYIVQGLSRSSYWPETAIFIIEDDPQSGFDHVEAHRSIAVIISPWVKRQTVSSVHYDIPSVYKTIEMILGVPPMNANDAMAPPIADIWVDTRQDADFTPYEMVFTNVPFTTNPQRGPGADRLRNADFSRPDHVPGLGLILWRMIKGNQPIPPYAKGIRY